MTFHLRFWSNSSDDSYRGLELSFRSLNGTNPGDLDWVPLMYFTTLSNITTTSPPFIELPLFETMTSERNFTLHPRGYRVPHVIKNNNGTTYYSVSVCGDGIFQYPIQFRWLQTQYQTSESINENTLFLDNIIVSARNATHHALLFEDCFDDQTSLK